MILYHGSYCLIDSIDLDVCRAHTDFGKGFYLTPIRSQAVRRARLKARLTLSEPVLNVYSFNEAVLNDGSLKVLRYDNQSQEWAHFVYSNREIPDFTHDYDIVVGPVADDNLRLQFNRIKRGELSFADLPAEIHYRDEDVQYCFCTPKAISFLKHLQ